MTLGSTVGPERLLFLVSMITLDSYVDLVFYIIYLNISFGLLPSYKSFGLSSNNSSEFIQPHCLIPSRIFIVYGNTNVLISLHAHH